MAAINPMAVNKPEKTPLYASESVATMSHESRRNPIIGASVACRNKGEPVLGVKRKASAMALRDALPSKRACISARNRLPATNKRVTPRGPDMLSNLCYDVSSYLLTLIHPKGLCALMRVNRAWRQTLTTPETIGVWKHSMLSAGVPEAPDGVSIIAWAFLLFGSTNCYNCQKGHAQSIDFVLMKRLCGTCRETGMIRHHNILKAECPTFLQMVPYRTDRGRVRKYYAAVADEIWKDYCSAKRTVCAIDSKDVEINMAAFRKEKQEVATKLVEDSNRYTLWVSDQKRERLEQVAARKQWIKDSFVEEGYNLLDVCTVLKRKPVSPDTQMTESGWNLIRGLYIEPLEKLNEHRRNERRKEREVDSRRMFIVAAYQAYGETLRPAERIKLPNLSVLTSFPPLSTLLNEPIEIEITEAQVRQTFEKDVPESLTNVIIPRLRKAYMEEIVSLHPNSTLAHVIQDKRECDPEPLDLVIATFRESDTSSSCPTYRPIPIFGFDHIVRFNSVDLDLAFKPIPEDPFRNFPPFDADYSATISALVVNVLKLDPKTTTSEQLDEMDTLLLCDSCTDHSSMTKKHRVCSWRVAVMHSIVESSHNRWRVLDEDQRKLAEARILAERYSGSWQCAFCTEQFPLRHTIVHLSQQHMVSSALPGQHCTPVPGEKLGGVDVQLDLSGQIMMWELEPFFEQQPGFEFDESYMTYLHSYVRVI